jgi:hypothetical protein
VAKKKRKNKTKTGKTTIVKHGLYLKLDENSLDQRTWIAQFIREGRLEILDFMGNDNPLVERLVKRILFKDLRLSSFELACLEDPDTPGIENYVKLANSFTRDLKTLKDLASHRRPEAVPTVEELTQEDE